MDTPHAPLHVPFDEQSERPLDKGLKVGAIGLIASIVIGVASTAPGYSVAASLGYVSGAVGAQAPAIMWISFVPMLIVAAAYYYLNRAVPDCGTNFTWVARAIGPRAGWLSGFASITACIVVMGSQAQIAGQYFFALLGQDALAGSKWWTLAAGSLFIGLLTWVCIIGIEVSARLQYVLLGAELLALVLFSAFALWMVYTNPAADSIRPSLDWVNPLAIHDWSALSAGVLVAVFVYWGWDSAVSVNEETSDATQTPGKAALVSTLILVVLYVAVAIAAQAVHGTAFLNNHADNVLEPLAGRVMPFGLDVLVLFAVFSSALAATQTTILPMARSTLAMALEGALPRVLGEVHPLRRTPHLATALVGALSIAWYVGFSVISASFLGASVAALGLLIAFYYGSVAIACPVYYRRDLLASARNLLFMGAAPLLGGAMLAVIFVESSKDLWSSQDAGTILGIGAPLVVGYGLLAVGALLMAGRSRFAPAFFARRREALPAPDAGRRLALVGDGAEAAATEA